MLSSLENEVIAAIGASALKPRLREVEGLPDIDGDNLVARFAAKAPAVYVSVGNSPVRDGKLIPRLSVAGVARNARGQKAARQGDPMTIGLNEILDALAILLDGASTASTSWGVTGISFMQDERLYKQGLYVGSVALEGGPIGIDKDADESTLDDFLRAYIDYDLVESGVGVDLSDHVNMPQ